VLPRSGQPAESRIRVPGDYAQKTLRKYLTIPKESMEVAEGVNQLPPNNNQVLVRVMRMADKW
jgi:hypothetical protein